MQNPIIKRNWNPVSLGGCTLYLPFYKYGNEQQKIWDQSGNNNHSTITGAVPIGLGWSFDGAATHVTSPNQSSLQIAGPMTALVWCRPTGAWPTVGQKTIVAKPLISIWRENYCLALGNATDNDNRDFKFQSNDGAGSVIQGSTITLPVGVNIWQYLAGLYDGANVKLFYNGVQLVSTNVGTFTPAVSTDSLEIGRDNYAASYTYYFNGQIGEVIILNRALSAQEIRNSYEMTRSRYGV